MKKQNYTRVWENRVPSRAEWAQLPCLACGAPVCPVPIAARSPADVAWVVAAAVAVAAAVGSCSWPMLLQVVAAGLLMLVGLLSVV